MADLVGNGPDRPGAGPSQPGQLGHRHSEDFADMLDAAASTLHDDDLLLSGPAGGSELTIEHIHNLSTAPQAGRTPSYHSFDGMGLSGGDSYVAAPTGPTGPTHIGDIIPMARPASSATSSHSMDGPRRTTSPEEEADTAVSALPRVAGRRTPPAKQASAGPSAAGWGGSRPGSRPGSFTTPGASPSGAKKGGLPRVALLAKPPPKKEEPLSPQRPTRPASLGRSPSSSSRSSAGPSPAKSISSPSTSGVAGRSSSASAAQAPRGGASAAEPRTSLVPGSRIPRPAGIGSPAPARPATADGVGRVPPSPQRSLSTASSPQRLLSSSSSFTSPSRPGGAAGARASSFSGAAGSSASARGLGSAAGSRTTGRASQRQPVSPSKLDTRQQLEELIKDLHDIKKDLGLVTDSEPQMPGGSQRTAATAAATPAPGAAGAAGVRTDSSSGAAAAGAKSEVLAAKARVAEEPAAEVLGGEPAVVALAEGEPADATAPLAEPGVARTASAAPEDASAAPAEGQGGPDGAAAEGDAQAAAEPPAAPAAALEAEQAAEHEAALGAAMQRLHSAAAANEATQEAERAAVVAVQHEEEEPLPASTGAGRTEATMDSDKSTGHPTVLETERVPEPAAAQQCCACTVM